MQVDDFVWPANDIMNLQMALGRREIPYPCQRVRRNRVHTPGRCELEQIFSNGCASFLTHFNALDTEDPKDVLFRFVN